MRWKMTIKPIQDFGMRDENDISTAAAKYIQGQLDLEGKCVGSGANHSALLAISTNNER